MQAPQVHKCFLLSFLGHSADRNPLPPTLVKDYSLTKVAPPPSQFNASFNAFEIDYRELTLESEIGKGSFGLVFKGTWRGGVVAIKRVGSDLLFDFV